MTRPLQCLTSLVVLALVLSQSGHCAVVKQLSTPGSKTSLYGRSWESLLRGFCYITPLDINEVEYEKRCGEKSDSKWPCFKGLGKYTFADVKFEPWLEPLDMSKEILLMDDEATGKLPDQECELLAGPLLTCSILSSAFTLRNASDAFTMWFVFDGVRLRYYDYDDKTGCYKIELKSKGYRSIFVSDGNGKDRDLDTQKHLETGTQLCSKWITVGIRM
ncbi:hypothetical protein NDA11_004038 [Ustilago hordei]|uniref:Related to Mig1 protein n=1 Tax=Ustilago hordei TaxID=120017 RepID=I2FY60_USTHO|nr:uncharacterized protein UHO2_04092 [Ustilago hordei]KAJ1579909.1 hypothetical protein NDA15_002026 [Ustilago hordei]KAJ1581814.1 hypothetical protein NDA12_002981 [Ustilago hordei]KAJ1582463.1 hypothetical protein NDA11_004038 [Ustilago hordei]CCF51853.1 related to Mig1 protein [Ustilago hordei]SYW86596.1 related to Mig1 protein [Ustilago hordei]